MATSIASGDFVTTTLSGNITDVATTMTIGTGLAIPATNGYLTIDYDSTIAVGLDDGPETVKYASYTSGTGAITGMTRGVDGNTSGVAHTSGCSIQYAPTSDVIKDAIEGSITGHNLTVAVDYQDDDGGSIGDNTVANQRICYGWGQKEGTGSPQMSETVTLPFTYDAAPTPMVSVGGTKANPAAADITALNSVFAVNTAVSAYWTNVTTADFDVYLSRSDTTNIAAGAQASYSWLTIGTEAPA